MKNKIILVDKAQEIKEIFVLGTLLIYHRDSSPLDSSAFMLFNISTPIMGEYFAIQWK